MILGSANNSAEMNFVHLALQKVDPVMLTYEIWLVKYHGTFIIQVKEYEGEIESLNNVALLDASKRTILDIFHLIALNFSIEALYFLICYAYVRVVSDVRMLVRLLVAKGRNDNRKRKNYCKK